MKLVVAEKPSVARDLARVLGATRRAKGALEGNGWTVTWCIGHLIELDEPQAYDAAWKRWSFATLPMLPKKFRLRPAKRTVDQWRIVRDLLRRRDFESVVNACDAGREGELIFRYAHERAGSKLPIERLWISSLTESAIRSGFEALRPGRAYEGLAAAARCRSQADWLVGLNATRAMTLISPYGSVYSIGRVQTPTLALIVDRELEIRRFEAEPYWELLARVSTHPPADARRAAEGGKFTAKWRALTGETRLSSERLARDLQTRVHAQLPLVVAEVAKKETRERAPQLFDLTALQRIANVRFGFSAERSLKGLQALYERHKAITYPRTSSRYLTSDQKPTLVGRIEKFSGHASYGEHARRLGESKLRVTSRIVDDKKVSDHHAIMPTGTLPRLTGDEAKLFDLVVTRFLAAFHPDARFQSTEVVLVAGKPAYKKKPGRTVDRILAALPAPPDHFVVRGRVVIDPGWQRVEPPRRGHEQQLPQLRVGERRMADLSQHRSETKPPPRYTDASLLGAMETAGKLVEDEQLREAMKECGLGTPATRASIIETLIRRDYVTRNKKALVPADKGVELIEKLPVPTLRSAELTGGWEARLSRIAEERLAPEDFMADVHALVVETVARMQERGDVPPDPSAAPDLSAIQRNLGACPRCHAQVVEQRSAFECVACPFRLVRRLAGRNLSASEIQLLLSEGRTGVLSGFRSKKKRRFRAALELVNGEVSFSFPGSRGSDSRGSGSRGSGSRGSGSRGSARRERSAGIGRAPDERLSGYVCPICSRAGLVSGRRAWGCAAWREGCKFVVPYVIDGKKLTANELRDLLTKGRTRKAKFAAGKGRIHLTAGRAELRMEPTEGPPLKR